MSKKKETESAPHTLLSGSIINAVLTLFSRLLGMFRDMATAMLFGVSASGVFDAFVLAFRLPNLFRRLFGEGAISISFQPAFCRQRNKSPSSAWELLTAAATMLSVILGLLTLIGVIICVAAIALMPGSSHLIPNLTLIMLPYLFLICQTAIFASALQSLKSWFAPAFAPVVMNALWLWAVICIAPKIPNPANQAYFLAVTISASAVIQLVLQIIVLRRFGYNFQRCLFNRIVPYWRRATAGWATMVIGLSAMQVCVVTDSIFAWLTCPTGTVSAVFLAERLFEFPLGLIGISVATAVYPLLNQHAAEKNSTAINSDMNQAVHLALFWGVPATAGLILLGLPLCQILFEHGATTPEDCKRIGTILSIYSAGVWAYCLLPILSRGFYSIGKSRIPAIVSLVTCAANAIANIILIFILPPDVLQFVLAATTAGFISLSAVALGVLWEFHRPMGALRNTTAGGTRVLGYIGATILMYAAGSGILALLPDEPSVTSRLVRSLAAFVICLTVYFSAAYVLISNQPNRSPEEIATATDSEPAKK